MEEQDFIYERKKLGPSLKIEEVTGGYGRKGRVWEAIAKQIYCENGRDGYREIGHLESGAPFLYDSNEKISISHTDHFLVVATIPMADEDVAGKFSPNAAIGIDAERRDREKVLKLRERFLTEEELSLVDATSLEQNIIAWTAKEALYKAALTPGIDWHHNLTITVLPTLTSPGEGKILFPDGDEATLTLLSYPSADCIVTVAFKT